MFEFVSGIPSLSVVNNIPIRCFRRRAAGAAGDGKRTRYSSVPDLSVYAQAQMRNASRRPINVRRCPTAAM